MTGPVRRRPNPWAVAAVAALALSSVAASCAQTVDPRSLVNVSPGDRASPSPSATPTRSPFLASPSPAEPSPSAVLPIEPPPPPPRWEAASTTFKTRANALKRLAKLKAHGFFGYKIERDKGRYEVEKEFSTAKAARAEVRRLARAGIRATVEPSTAPT